MDNNFENPYFKPETPAVQPENNFVEENSNPPAQQAVVGSNFTVNPDITPQVNTPVTSQPVETATSHNPSYNNGVTEPAPAQAPYSCEWYGGMGTNVNPAPAPEQQPPYTPNYTVSKPVQNSTRRSGVSKGLFFAGIAVCLCLSFIAGFIGTGVYDYLSSVDTEIKNGLTINKVDASNANTAYTDSGLSTVEIVNKTADSVVEITTETVTTGIFAQQFINSGAGSGVIVDSEGFIVTNHHVVDGATKVSVTLRDGTSFDAKVVGSDAELDVALLEIDPGNVKLIAATFGDSDTIKVGQRTVAIGNPLGQLGGSVTEGIVSALNRDVVIDGQTMSLMQTDTAINPGNSGGGLFDQNGNLIGIVNAKSSGSEIEGLGFAIPINDVINVIGDLSEFGYVRGRVSLGMTFIDVNSQQLAWMYGLDKTGCYIYSVDKNTNADNAGFTSGDRVISVNGKEVTTSDDVENIIKNCAVGEKVTFKVENTSGKTNTISFELEEYIPEEENENFFENGNSGSDFSYWWSEFN